ncbi:acylphosphatase family [Tasmannia lanceolata]|uniref:acylphosphatase family n=1 Tax=Tasmannia lanceolata TaxID=3420 RepID=UPI00406336A4
MNTIVVGLSMPLPTNPQMPIKTVKVLIKGRVQGVFYRNWTIDNARELGLKGWVRNRRDGSVEALFSGDPNSVQEMESRCRRGPPSALVTALDVRPSDEDPGPEFDRKPTV